MKKQKKYKNIKVNDQEKGMVKASDIKKEKIIKKVNKTINLITIIIAPILLVFFAMLIQKETAEKTFDWMGSNYGMVVLNIAIILAFYFTFQFLTKKPGLSFAITSIIYLSFPIISKLKFDIRGEVLLINDLALVGNLGEVSRFAEVSDNLKVQLILITIALIVVTLSIAFRKIKTNRVTSGVFSLLFITALLLIFLLPVTSNSILRRVGINNNIRYAPNIIHEKQGTWLGLYSNFVMNRITVPEGYSKTEVFNILDVANQKQNIPNESGNSKGKNKSNLVSKETPNVIVIMSESFFDPTVIPGVEYSQDPIPNTRKLLEKCESGTMISSTFAGGTSTIEFEVFTGETVEFMPYGTVPYTDIPKSLKSVDTIQRIFKENGYETIALHDYDGTFYNRIEVYPYLGFDKFLESKDMDEIYYFGKYISDYTINKNIMLQLEEKRQSNNPLFIWALTMQNHTPFQTSNFTEGFDRIKIKSDVLSEEAQDKLLAYVNGIYESDIQLKKLIDYLDQSDEPTVLLFFGDHLPSLYEVYYDTGMIKTKETINWTTEEMKTMHTVPYFIYDNYSNKEKNHDNITGAVLLGNRLLNYIGINKSSYFRFLDTLNYNALRDRLFIDKNGNIYDEIPKECTEIANEHKLLEYDMIYGKNYVKEYEEMRKK